MEGKDPSEGGKIKRCLGVAVVIGWDRRSGQPVQRITRIGTRWVGKSKENRFDSSIGMEESNCDVGVRDRLKQSIADFVVCRDILRGCLLSFSTV
jgi:hypothetical protein